MEAPEGDSNFENRGEPAAIIMETIRWEQVAADQRVVFSISAKRNYESQFANDTNRIGDLSRFPGDSIRRFQRPEKMLVGVISSVLPPDIKHMN